MSTETNDKLEGIFGGEKAATGAGDAATDKDARIAELERELQRQRVESGRLKKANEEIETLKSQIAEANKAKQIEGEIAKIPEDIRGNLPEDFVRAAAALQANANEQHRKEVEAMREENTRRERESFVNRINLTYPSFLENVSDGGNWQKAWSDYQRYNRDSIVTAFRSSDFDMLAYHIRKFCDENGLQVPSGGQGSATIPDPRSLGGGGNGESTHIQLGKTYTRDEFNQLYDKLEDARDRGDFAEMKRIDSEIKKAPAEGRVKQ